MLPVRYLPKSETVYLMPRAPSKDGRWNNYLLVVPFAKGNGVYKIGWDMKLSRWAESSGYRMLHHDYPSEARELLAQAAALTTRKSLPPTPYIKGVDDLLEKVAASVAESGPTYPAAVADALGHSRATLSRKLKSRLPYTSKCGILTMELCLQPPAGWVGRPPKWWLIVTPISSESGAETVAVDAKQTAEQREIEERRREIAIEDRERAERQAERKAELDESWRLRSEWYVEHGRMPDGFRMHPTVAARLEAEKQAQSNIPFDDDLPW